MHPVINSTNSSGRLKLSGTVCSTNCANANGSEHRHFLGFLLSSSYQQSSSAIMVARHAVGTDPGYCAGISRYSQIVNPCSFDCYGMAASWPPHFWSFMPLVFHVLSKAIRCTSMLKDPPLASLITLSFCIQQIPIDIEATYPSSVCPTPCLGMIPTTPPHEQHR